MIQFHNLVHYIGIQGVLPFPFGELCTGIYEEDSILSLLHFGPPAIQESHTVVGLWNNVLESESMLQNSYGSNYIEIF